MMCVTPATRKKNNDLRPMSLTPIIQKMQKNIVMEHVETPFFKSSTADAFTTMFHINDNPRD